jgi:serine/threonine-protein kinase
VRDLADALADVLTPGQRWLEPGDENEPGSRPPKGLSIPAPAADTLASPEPQFETGASVAQTASTAATRSRRRIFLGASAAAIVVVGVGIAFRRPQARGVAGSFPSTPPALSAVVPVAASSVSVPASPSMGPSTVTEELRQANLVVSPRDAFVEVDGVKVPLQDGGVPITGRLGSVHRVRVFKGKNELHEDVVIAESGVRPSEMDLPPPKPKVLQGHKKPDVPRENE